MIDKFLHNDNWQEVKNATMTTIGKSTGKYPDAKWKKRLILAEHSPIRKLSFTWRFVNLPYWVSTHFVRHKFGIDHWISTQRSDRIGEDRSIRPQGAGVNMESTANAQALINISRKRLCNCASPETRGAWLEVKAKVAETEPELASCMVRECIYRGFCPEFIKCGYADTEEYQKELAEYRSIN